MSRCHPRRRQLLATGLVGLLAALVPATASAVTQAIPAAVSSDTWTVANALPPSGPSTTFGFGPSDQLPFMGDWNGDGLRTPGYARNGVIRVSNSLPPAGATISVTFGSSSGFPVAGDFNGDGRDDIAVYYDGLWQIRMQAGGIGSGGAVTTRSFNFGSGKWPLTWPVAGNWDGTGSDGIGVHSVWTGTWQLRQTAEASGTNLAPFVYSPIAYMLPVVGDWDADGTDSVGGKSGSTWLLNNQNDASATDITFTFGGDGFPVIGGVFADAKPKAVNDSATVAEDSGASAVNVLGNDTDVDGGPKSVASVTQPAHGTVVVTGGGTGLTYAPNANYCNSPPGTSPDTFTYTLAPGGSSATVSMTVTCVDDPPVAVADSATVIQDSGANAVGVLGNDTDVDGGPKAVASVTQPAHGTVVVTGGGTGLTYAPAASYCNSPPGTSPDTFTYTLTPGGSSATVSMTVTCLDDPPVAVNDSATVAEDSGASAVNVLGNDTDVDGGPKAIASVTQPAHGTVVVTGGGTGLTYTPAANYCNSPPGTSPDTFTYTLAPGGSSATVSMTVTCVDDPPVAVNDSATVAEDSGASAVGVLGNDTDIDGGPKAIASVTQPAHGTVVVTGGGTGLTYAPAANYCNSPPGSSPDTFTYTLAPGGSSATVSMTVTCAPDAPVVQTSAGNLAYTENDPATPVDPGVTVTDVDGGASIAGATVAITSNFAGGQDVLALSGIHPGISALLSTNTLTLTGTATPAAYQSALRDVRYVNTSDTPSTLVRTVTFTVTDDTALSGSNTRGIQVTAVDDAPVAVNDSATVAEDSGASAVGVLGNDTDIDGGPKAIASVTQPAHGTVVVTGGGTGLTYAPAANYCNSPPGSSPDTFTYTLAPGGSSATVSMTVTCAPDAPVVQTSAGNLAYTENDPATPVDPGVTVTDVDGGASIAGATVAITSNFAGGQDVLALSGIHPGISALLSTNTLTLTGTATPAAYQAALRDVTYLNTSQAPSTLTRTVTFTVTDDTALSGSNTRGVAVTGVNDPPTAVDDTGTTDEDTALVVAAPGVLANDTDVDPGDTKTVVALNGSATLTGSSSQGGAVTIGADGSYTYTPPAAFQSLSTGESDSDAFQYTMADGAGAQSTATVNLTVDGVSDAPTAVADTFDVVGNTGLFVGTTKPAGDAGKVISGSLLSNDTDPDTPPANLVAEPVTNAATPLGGTITIESDGSFTYQPDDVDTGVTDTFSYRVCDASPCNAGTVANAVGTIDLVIAGQVWYVRNNQAPGGDGTSDTPFDTLVEAETASGPGDTAYVFDGNNTTTNLDTGYVMDAGERLIGEVSPLSVDPDGGGPLPTTSLFGGTPMALPTLTASNEDVVSMAASSVLDGLQLDPAGTGGGIAAGPGAGGGAAGNVTVANVDVVDTGTAGTQPGIELDATTGVNRFSDTTVSNGGSATAIGVRINNAGTVIFAAPGTTTITTSGAKALDVSATNMGTSQFDAVKVTGSATGAVRLSSNTGQTVLGDGAGMDLSLQTTSGTAAALDVSNGGAVQVDAAGTDTISATGGPAADIRNTNGASFDFDSVSSTNSTTDGINLDTNLATPFIAAAGAISGAAGIAVDVNAGGAAGAAVSYAGAINDGAGASVEITNRDGGVVALSGNIADGPDGGGGITVSANSGGATTFSGASKVINTGASDAVLMTGNAPSSSLAFTGGGLDIDATSGRGIEASSNGATIEVSGAGNSITTTTGRALNVTNTPISTNDLTFQSIAANGAANGIVLNNTGGAGRGLTVTGTGAAGSGGTIQNTTSDSIALTTTNDVSLTSMNVANSGESGILGSAVTNLSLASSSLTNNGNDSGDAGIKLANLWGTSAWSALSVTGSALANVLVDNTSGTLNALNITGASHFDSLGTAFGGNSVLLEMRGTAVMTSANIDGATFVDNKPARGLTVQAQDSGKIGDAGSNALVIQNSTFTNNGLQASFEQSGTANLTFRMLNNGTPAAPLTMPNTPVGTSHAVNVASSSTSTAGTIRGRVSGNRIGNQALAGSGSAIGNGIRVLLQGKTAASLLIDGNTIRQVPQARGIDVQALGPLDASGAGPIDVTVTNNDVNPQDTTGFPLSAIYVAADSQGGGPVTLRTDIRGNTVPAGVASDGVPTFLALDKVLAAAVCQLVDTPPASANATAQLTSTNTGSASAAAGCTLIAGPITTPP